jgi:hypothetical protein
MWYTSTSNLSLATGYLESRRNLPQLFPTYAGSVSNRPRPFPSTVFTTIIIHSSFYLSKESASIHQPIEQVRNTWSYATIPHRHSWRGAHFRTGAALLLPLSAFWWCCGFYREPYRSIAKPNHCGILPNTRAVSFTVACSVHVRTSNIGPQTAQRQLDSHSY